ncbi:MAG: iron ABC transporter permease [Anaerolineales bacterium]|nr:iron ABC transporter permease [Anaerolineales bacterium]
MSNETVHSSSERGRGGSRFSPWLLAAALFLVAVVNISVGSISIPPLNVIGILANKTGLLHITTTWPQTFEIILYDIRLPHTVLLALTGMALAASGSAYQGLFRNPLADPYILGIASGAGLGAVLAMSVKWPYQLSSMFIIPAAAFVGAMITVWLVYSLAKIGRSTPVSTLILAGVAVSSFMSSITSLIMILSREELHRAVSWLFGGFSLGGWEPVLASLPYYLIGISLMMVLGRPLNVLQFGDDQAKQMGLNVERYKLVIVVTASMVAATAVSFSGIIGFVGLIVPHIVRLIWGADYRRIIPRAVLGGGIFLLLTDIIARVVMAPSVLPVGVVTSVIGAPFFLWLLRKTRREIGYW